MSDATVDAERAKTTRESALGVAIITLAKGWFLLTGFAQPVLLTRFLGVEEYGLYGVVLGVISILNNVVVAGSIQSMSRAVTEGGTTALRRGLLLHLVLGVALSGLLVALAGAIGAGMLHDPRLPRLLRVGALVVLNYSVYAALVGALNGQRRFVGQAGLDITFATLRTGVVVGAAAAGFGVFGSVAGFAGASGVILCLALALNARDLRGGEPEEVEGMRAFLARYARFFLPVLVYQLALNVVFQADLLVMKALLPHATVEDIAASARLAGLYKAVQNFAFLPYQLLLAVTFVVFPIVSKQTLEGDREGARAFVRSALRFSALALGAMLAVIAGVPARLLLLAFPAEFALGAPALRALVLGQGAFALAVIGTTILLGAGRAVTATLVMLAMVVAVIAGDALGVTLSGGGAAALLGTAVGTAVGCAAGLAAVGVILRRSYGAFVPPASAARAAAAAVVAALVGSRVPLPGKVGTLLVAGVIGAVYVAALLAMGELGASEREALRRVLGRGRRAKRGS